VGSLEEYEEYIAEGYVILDNYLTNCAVDFLDERHEEERRKVLQKKFEDNLLNFKCSDCGTKYENMVIVEGKILCQCDNRWNVLCVNCKTALQFDNDRNVFCCPKCFMVFKRPVLEVAPPPSIPIIFPMKFPN